MSGFPNITGATALIFFAPSRVAALQVPQRLGHNVH